MSLGEIVIDGCVLSVVIGLFWFSWGAVIIGFVLSIVLDYYREKRRVQNLLEETA